MEVTVMGALYEATGTVKEGLEPTIARTRSFSTGPRGGRRTR